jgi:hypothetical protein
MTWSTWSVPTSTHRALGAKQGSLRAKEAPVRAAATFPGCQWVEMSRRIPRLLPFGAPRNKECETEETGTGKSGKRGAPTQATGVGKQPLRRTERFVSWLSPWAGPNQLVVAPRALTGAPAGAQGGGAGHGAEAEGQKGGAEDALLALLSRAPVEARLRLAQRLVEGVQAGQGGAGAGKASEEDAGPQALTATIAQLRGAPLPHTVKAPELRASAPAGGRGAADQGASAPDLPGANGHGRIHPVAEAVRAPPHPMSFQLQVPPETYEGRARRVGGAGGGEAGPLKRTRSAEDDFRRQHGLKPRAPPPAPARLRPPHAPCVPAHA